MDEKAMVSPKYYPVDIEAARLAHNANSMRAFDESGIVGDYQAQVDDAYRMAATQAEEHPNEAEKAFALADRFAKSYATWLNEGFSIDAMCPSVLVAGAANFPTAKKERQNARRDAHMAKYEKIMAMKSRIATVGSGGIKASDEDAIERLEAKAKRLEERHDLMKRANAYYRKHGTLEGFEGLSTGKTLDAEECIESVTGKPFPSYALTNNLANIKRVRARIDSIKRAKESRKEDREIVVNGEACTVVENADAMRLQLFFDGKPSAETRALLKKSGFRWAPSQGAWQRQLTNNARVALRSIEEAAPCQIETDSEE